MRDVEIIPNWTAEDYQTTTPFEWLYKYRDNRFLMLQLCNKIRALADAQGVKNFMTLWKAYLETVQRQTGVPTENATSFSGQPIELMCGNYVCDDYGVTTTDKFGFEVVVCSHPIMPVRRLVNVDTSEIKVEIAFKRRNRWRTLIADKGQIASSQRIVELAKYGVAVDSESSRDLVKYLSAIENLNYDRIDEIASVGRLGWIADQGFSPYVENVSFDGDVEFGRMFNAVQPCGEFEEWLACAREVRKHGIVARLAIAASFASVLIEPLHTLPFILHLWGGTESGKTVALMIATSVWANPAKGEYWHTFNSTTVGLEMYAGFCNSLPLCVDELQISKDRKSFDQQIYVLAEGVGRLRGKKNGGIRRTETWSNCTLTTGEMPITNEASGGGAINRVIEIDCKDEKLFADPAGVVSVIRQNYGHAGRVFVEALKSDAGWIDLVKETQKAYYEQLVKLDNMEKQSAAASLILTADALADQVIFHDGIATTADEIAEFLTSRDDVDVNCRAYNWLIDFISANPTKFNPNQYGDYSGECWGRISDGCAYINKSVFDAKMNDAGFSPSAFLSWAKRKDLIVTQPPNNTRVARVQGRIGRFICLVLPPERIEFEDYHGSTPFDENEEKQQRLL